MEYNYITNASTMRACRPQTGDAWDINYFHLFELETSVGTNKLNKCLLRHRIDNIDRLSERLAKIIDKIAFILNELADAGRYNGR